MIEQKMQQIEQFVKQKFDEAKQRNTQAALKALQQREKQAMEQSNLARHSEGYTADNLPTEDFLAYVALLKKACKENVSEHDRYTFFKDAIPKRIHKVHTDLKKAFKQDGKQGDADEQLEILKQKIEDKQDEIEAEKNKKDELEAKIKELKKNNKDLAKKNKLKGEMIETKKTKQEELQEEIERKEEELQDKTKELADKKKKRSQQRAKSQPLKAGLDPNRSES